MWNWLKDKGAGFIAVGAILTPAFLRRHAPPQ